MVEGEQIFSDISGTTYSVLEHMQTSGQAEIAIAKSNKSSSLYIIKRLIAIKYSSKEPRLTKCLNFENDRKLIYKLINSKTMSGASCTPIIDFFRHKTFYYIVTEKIQGVSLNAKDVAKYISFNEKIFLLKVMAYSLLPLEDGGIIHGDIKPENFILKKVKNHFVVKLIDMESSYQISKPPLKGDLVGTEPYYSPETYLYNIYGNNYDSSLLSTKSDIFSLGIIFYEILLGMYPVSPDNLERAKYVFELKMGGKEVYFPSGFNQTLKSLIESMIDILPTKRPGILEILQNLKSVEWQNSNQSCEIQHPYVVREIGLKGEVYICIYSLQDDIDIYYSLNGSMYKQYKTPILISDDDLELTIRVVKRDEKSSEMIFTEIVSVTSHKQGKVERPMIIVRKGVVEFSSKTVGAIIHYTLNGDIPSRKSSSYIAPFRIENKTEIKAIAVKCGMNSSSVNSVFANPNSVIYQS